jgi:hypothetical protein
MATGVTFTSEKLYCNAGLQSFEVETGLTFLNGELQYLLLEHNKINMMGYLKKYNPETGILKIDIEVYNGGGGYDYKNWTITTIDHPIRDLNINYDKLKELSKLSGETYATYDEIGDLATIVKKIYKGINSANLLDEV